MVAEMHHFLSSMTTRVYATRAQYFKIAFAIFQLYGLQKRLKSGSAIIIRHTNAAVSNFNHMAWSFIFNAQIWFFYD